MNTASRLLSLVITESYYSSSSSTLSIALLITMHHELIKLSALLKLRREIAKGPGNRTFKSHSSPQSQENYLPRTLSPICLYGSRAVTEIYKGSKMCSGLQPALQPAHMFTLQIDSPNWRFVFLFKIDKTKKKNRG